jgi:hypothetical protein
MNKRNWIDLSRKLVERTDLDYTTTAFQQALGEAALSYWGEGVLPTTFYPSPFLITKSGTILGGTVGNGIAHDANGQITRIDSSSSTSKVFTATPADPSLPRWDLVCIQYVASGDTLIPKPSDPILTVPLNLVDDFQLVLVTGTPSVTPVFPAKGNALYIVLAGMKIPGAATLGTQCQIDFTVREFGIAGIVGAPVFRQETPTGTVDGTNTVFNLALQPLNPQSLLVTIDGVTLTNSEFSIVNQTITCTIAPALGQSIYAYYVANTSTGQNPLSGAQEVPSGVVDGINDSFSLAGQVINQSSTIVFVDGIVSEVTEWNLVQGSNTSSILFNTGSIPATGQSVYVFYLVNAASFGGVTRTLTPETAYYTLSPTDITNGFVMLPHNPANVTSVLCDIIGNTGQIYGDDFTVSGMTLSWTGLGMQSVLFSGSKLRVNYLY